MNQLKGAKTRLITHYFTVATLIPLILICLGALFGGVWALAAFIFMTFVTLKLDMLKSLAVEPDDPAAEFPAAEALQLVLALGHFVMLAFCVRAFAYAEFSWLSRILILLAAAQFMGQVSNANAHELIHKPSRALRALGMWIYISHGFGHHTSAHPLVHHIWAATPKDPNSAPKGMSFYVFLPRAWLGSFRLGLAAENARRRKGALHPYLVYAGGFFALLAMAQHFAGWAGFWGYLLLSWLATSQLLLSDYVQHYGLRRKKTGDRYEPFGARHAWNAPQPYTRLMMLNAPRHSDHHMHPMKPYPSLIIDETMPQLPRSMPVMGFIALMPWVWREVMDRRVDELGGIGR